MNNYINLIDKLSDLDKKRITNFINKYGVQIQYFEGLDKWLQNWSHSNQKLYKLLGNNFIYKVKYCYQKSESEIQNLVKSRLIQHNFATNYNSFITNYIKPLYDKGEITTKDYNGFSISNFTFNIAKDKIQDGIKYKGKNKKRTLQIQAGMKPIKALQKIVEYFKEDFVFDLDSFEDFKKIHSLIMNDKKLIGNLCISIHPLDFLTMSDNNSNWSSCMSWEENGCYHLGTVEMMNSNNVLCCYLEAEDPYCFDKDHKNDPEFSWTNKKWRILSYITKDIIMGGKAYPYDHEEIIKFLILQIKNLASSNLNWNYTFGPELYQDMKYIFSNYPLERSRSYIARKNTKKHNILWDTKGMYNDMLNDHNTKYWCYRNKVKQNKVISVSGKAPCLCCGGPILELGYDYDYDYNERYSNYGEVICNECKEEFFCERCNETNPLTNHSHIRIKKGDSCFEKIICDTCAERYIKYCPDCGSPMYINNGIAFAYKKPSADVQFSYDYYYYIYNDDKRISDFYHPICICQNCAKHYEKLVEKIEVKTYYGAPREIYIFKDNKIEDNFLYRNLVSVPKEVYTREKIINQAIRMNY